MIVTDLDHTGHPLPLTPSLRKAVEFLRGPEITGLPDGRTEIDGDRVFALIQRYETVRMDAPKFEHHRKYIDVQFIVSGEESIGWAPAGAMQVTEAYDSEKDICFGTVAAGKVSWDERRLTKIAARTGGRVEKLHVDFTGTPVREGQPLLEIYSPDLVASQREYLVGSLDQLKQYQFLKLKKIITQAYERVPFYRERFREIGFNPNDIRNAEDILRIPPTTKEDIMLNFPEGITVQGMDRTQWKYVASSGTTRQIMGIHDFR